MNINPNNEIDKKLLQSYPEKILKGLEFGKIGYLGMNITTSKDSNIDFKIYLDNELCTKQYQKLRNSQILNELFDRKLIKHVEFALDKEKTNYSRYYVKIRSRNRIAMNSIYEFIEQKTNFFNKYKSEIITLSGMESGKENTDSTLFILGFFEDNFNNIKKLKCYWLTKHYDLEKEYSKKYYLDFLKKSSNKEILNLLPVTEDLLVNCKADLWMVGIDYTKEKAEKHKIYLDTPENLYEGLLETFKDKKELINKIQLIQKWNQEHIEFYCDGFAISQNNKNEIAINFYFKLKMDKLKNIINRIQERRKL